MAEFMHDNVFRTFLRHIGEPCVECEHSGYRRTASPAGFHSAVPDFRHTAFARSNERWIVFSAKVSYYCFAKLSLRSPAYLFDGGSLIPQKFGFFKRSKDHLFIGGKKRFNLLCCMPSGSRNMHAAVRPDAEINVFYLFSLQLIGYHPSAQDNRLPSLPSLFGSFPIMKEPRHEIQPGHRSFTCQGRISASPAGVHPCRYGRSADGHCCNW